MKILILTQWFTPEPTIRGLAFARELCRHGHEVQVLTGFPNYPDGKVYPGYRLRILQRERADGIDITRTYLHPSHNRNRLGRVANYLSFALSSTVLGLVTIKRPDIVYAYHPPATVALPAMILSRFFRVPYVYEVQDLWPDTLRATGMITHDRVLAIVGWWCRIAYHRAARIVVQSEGFKHALVDRGVPEGRVAVISNWCDESQIKSAPRNEQLARRLGLDSTFNVIFAGTMGKAQELDIVFEGAAHIQKRISRVRFVFVGGGVEVDHLKEYARSLGLTNVVFLAKQPMAEISDVLNLADAFLVHLRKDPLFEITIPSKIQTYLAIGKPILAGVEGNAAELVKSADAGIVYSPGSSSAFVQAVSDLLRMNLLEQQRLGENGRKYYVTRLSMPVGVSQLDTIFRQVAG